MLLSILGELKNTTGNYFRLDGVKIKGYDEYKSHC